MVNGASEVLWSEWDAGWRARGHESAEGLASAGEALSSAVGRGRLTEDEAALARTLDQLYSSEIDVRVTHNAAGWTGEIGDERNGFVERSPVVPLRILLDWLPSAACRAFPRSDYAHCFPLP